VSCLVLDVEALSSLARGPVAESFTGDLCPPERPVPYWGDVVPNARPQGHRLARRRS
jgi:hypothetical protein